MKTTILLMLLPFVAAAQKVPDFKLKDKQFCKEAVELYGFTSFSTERYSLAGKEDCYPPLTRVFVIDLSGQCGAPCVLIDYVKSKQKLLEKIAEEYCAMQLTCYPDATHTRVMFEIVNANAMVANSAEVYSKLLHSFK